MGLSGSAALRCFTKTKWCGFLSASCRGKAESKLRGKGTNSSLTVLLARRRQGSVCVCVCGCVCKSGGVIWGE